MHLQKLTHAGLQKACGWARACLQPQPVCAGMHLRRGNPEIPSHTWAPPCSEHSSEFAWAPVHTPRRHTTIVPQFPEVHIPWPSHSQVGPSIYLFCQEMLQGPASEPSPYTSPPQCTPGSTLKWIHIQRPASLEVRPREQVTQSEASLAKAEAQKAIHSRPQALVGLGDTQLGLFGAQPGTFWSSTLLPEKT